MEDVKLITTMTYKEKRYVLIGNNKNITKFNHCEFCDFKQYCEEYIEEEGCFACGCDFEALPVYFKVDLKT